VHLRLELFPADLDAFFDFYTRVLAFEVERDERTAEWPYVAVRRGEVRLGAVRAWEPGPEHRLPPQGVEIVLEVDDVVGERDRIATAGWPLVEDLVVRPWGLTDFRLLDPDGHFLRITSRG
jgi:lactoylglutathione lyase